jgi:hypothetical protein
MDSLYEQYIRNYGLTKPDAYTPYAAGYKMYGGGRSMPTSGPVDKQGYQERDLMNRARRDALLRRMRAEQAEQFMSPAYLNGAQ